jgi:hypothetical protein
MKGKKLKRKKKLNIGSIFMRPRTPQLIAAGISQHGLTIGPHKFLTISKREDTPSTTRYFAQDDNNGNRCHNNRSWRDIHPQGAWPEIIRLICIVFYAPMPRAIVWHNYRDKKMKLQLTKTITCFD